MEMSNHSDPLVLTAVETARLLRIGRGTVYEYIRCGSIPSIRIGRRILVPRAALERMLSEAGMGQPATPSQDKDQ